MEVVFSKSNEGFAYHNNKSKSAAFILFLCHTGISNSCLLNDVELVRNQQFTSENSAIFFDALLCSTYFCAIPSFRALSGFFLIDFKERYSSECHAFSMIGLIIASLIILTPFCPKSFKIPSL